MFHLLKCGCHLIAEHGFTQKSLRAICKQKRKRAHFAVTILWLLINQEPDCSVPYFVIHGLAVSANKEGICFI